LGALVGTCWGQQLNCPIPSCSANISCNFTNSLGLPQVAVGPVIPSTPGWLVISLGGGAYWLGNGLYSMGFFVSTEGVIVIDTPLAHDVITAAIRSVTSLPVKILIYTHSHLDHIGGANLFIADWSITRVISQTLVNRTLTQWNDTRRPVPTEVFVNSMTVTLGNQSLALTYTGEGHEVGNIFVYSAATKVLVLIDVIFPGYVPFKGNAISTDFLGWLQEFNTVLTYDFTAMVCGHVNRIGYRDDVVAQIAFFNDLMNVSAIANQRPFTDGNTAANPNDPWMVINTWIEKINEACFCMMAPKYKCTIGGFESFGRDACWVMTEYLRVEWGGAYPVALPPLEPANGGGSTSAAAAARLVFGTFTMLGMFLFHFIL